MQLRTLKADLMAADHHDSMDALKASGKHQELLSIFHPTQSA
jgi:hypothetical protein